MYSAIKIGGQRLYDLARKGVEVERESRNVTVYNLQLLKNDPRHKPPEFIVLDVECSGGFYIRSLIADLAANLGTVAHMTELLRTKQGQLTLDDCLHKENFNAEMIRTNINSCSEKLALDDNFFS